MKTAKTRWSDIIKSPYLGGFDLDDGNGAYIDIVVTVKEAKVEKVRDQNGREEPCLVLHFQERVKPMILNKTNAKMLSKHAGSSFVEDWPGTRLTVGTERVKAFGDIHDALRIRKVPPRKDAVVSGPIVACEDCNDTIKGTGKTSADQVIAGTEKTYGAKLCLSCATKRQEKMLEEKSNGSESE